MIFSEGLDLTPFKLDIDELLDDYTKEELTSLADMKRLWAAKKFSYIYKARPMHMVSEATQSRRLGGLYCLYCLYEIQPYKPHFKIYWSLGELQRLKILVIDAKQNGIGVVPALVNRMLDKNMFLFGSVDIAGGSITQSVDDMMKLQNKRVQIVYQKLLSNTRIEDYVHMDLVAELGLEALKEDVNILCKSEGISCQSAKMQWIAQFDPLRGSAPYKMKDSFILCAKKMRWIA